jgi:hypothetical protein
MSKASKHKNTPAEFTLKRDICGKNSGKNKCKGFLLEVLARYESRGRVHKERECTHCERIIRDPEWIRIQQARRQKMNYAKTNSNSSFTNYPVKQANRYGNPVRSSDVLSTSNPR